MRITAPATALLVALLAIPAVAEESTRQDFEDFCQAWEGRWVSKTTMTVAAPGIGKVGDKFTAYADCKIAHDGNAMICKYYGGSGSATWIAVYDAANKQIKSLWVTSGGVINQASIYKKDGLWMETVRGSQADGTTIEIAFTITVTNNGKTHTWKSTPIIGGKKMAEEISVWKRANK